VCVLLCGLCEFHALDSFARHNALPLNLDGHPPAQNVSNEEDGALIVNINSQDYSFDNLYGLFVCYTHGLGRAPYCNVPGWPSWCASPWCYVRAPLSQLKRSLAASPALR
jgi:hypothetical protein